MLRAELDQSSQPLWRVSSGTAAVLGLMELRMDAAPTTAYIMLGERCQRNCAYCAQARSSTASAAALSRVSWPTFPAVEIAQAAAEASNRGAIRRVCLQVTVGPDALAGTLSAVELFKQYTQVPICCSTAVRSVDEVSQLLCAGADKVTLALDAASEAVYRRVRGADWARTNQLLEQAAFSYPGQISSHLIVGLGESERDLVERLRWFHERGINVGLFAMTPLPGTRLAAANPPALASYRRMQAARHLMYACGIDARLFAFSSDGRLTYFGSDAAQLTALLGDGTAFRTSGCPDCNRPYYNERPGGVIYNYPRALTDAECQHELQALTDSLQP